MKTANDMIRETEKGGQSMQTVEEIKNSIYIVDRNSLRAAIRNNSGKPVYITEDNHDVLMKLRKGGVSAKDIGLLDEISKALQDEDKKPEGIHQIIKEDTNSPVILLCRPDNKKGTKVFDILTKANFVVFRQDINKRFEPITCSGLESVRAEIVEQYRDNYSVGGNIFEFDNVISSNVNTPAIPTDFAILDRVIDGGLYEGIYTIGAISSLGKTTFCLNVADQIATQGHDVIILSLEMSKYQIMSKAISRLTFCKYQNDDSINYDWCKTSRGITDGSRYKYYSPDELELISQAKKHYAEAIGKHLFIYESVGDMTVNNARDIIKQHIDYTGNRPVVIVDYLQLLQHDDKYINGNDKLRVDANITALKRISRDYKLPIILISSFNRMNYETEVTFAAFKDSGNIEYSSDVVIGMQLAGVGRGDFNVNEAKAKNPREIELIILKNREGKIGQKIKFSYYPMFNHFVEDELIEG